MIGVATDGRPRSRPPRSRCNNPSCSRAASPTPPARPSRSRPPVASPRRSPAPTVAAPARTPARSASQRHQGDGPGPPSSTRPAAGGSSDRPNRSRPPAPTDGVGSRNPVGSVFPERLSSSGMTRSNMSGRGTSGSGPLRTPVSSASILDCSSAVSSKSKTSKFSAIRPGLVDFGIAERPCAAASAASPAPGSCRVPPRCRR